MNFPDHIQTLMLSALYGEMTAKEQQEWEQILAGNDAAKQEFERLQRTIGILNEAEKEEKSTKNAEEDTFYEEQWSALQRLRQEEKKPVILTLPEVKPRAQFFQMPRRYLAAATVLILLGFGVSVYRWQLKEEHALTQAVKPPSEKSAESPNNTAFSDNAPASSNETVLGDATPNSSPNRAFGIATQKQATPTSIQGNDAPAQRADDILLPKDRDNTPSGAAMPKEQEQKPTQQSKEVLEEKQDAAKREIPTQSAPIQAETETNRAASEEQHPTIMEQKSSAKPDVMRLYSAPASTTPPGGKFLPQNNAVRKSISSTGATMRLDSAQKRDSLRNNR
ncbi:MAG: hypothetical protein MUF71_12880 [Candidatus Kapabacteria bacterium]|jgi:hypothetical protein|nr:hypothetical protein [Candidatus Kapabacteria bacterium]